MELSYVQPKERRLFGRQYGFGDKSDTLAEVSGERELFRNYILRNPVSQGTQCSRQFAGTVVNTEVATYEHRGINHTEGGWPKDVNFHDPEQTVRYKRKIEKDETYIGQVMNLTKQMEHYIFQNNAVNIYENYFTELDSAPLVEKSSSRTLNVYRDPSNRPVSHLSWSPDGGTKLAVSHCDRSFNTDKLNAAKESYIWEIENPNAPLTTLDPPCPIVCLEYNPKDPSSLASGMHSGQVVQWDLRSGRAPTYISDREICHRDAVNSVLWINSKSGTEFFSGGADGQVIWWDSRKLNEPLDRLYMDPVRTDEQNLTRSYGVSVLEYETTIPTRFMCGTSQGMLFSCNRKGKSPMEKINFRIPCHLSPVYSVTRNPAFVKNYLTVGDWTARIWSEDCRESAIIWTKNHESLLTAGVWSATKCSLFFITRMDGVLDCWDILLQQNEPVLAVKVCDEPLQCIASHEGGKLVSTANTRGITYLIEVSENMAFSSKNDKPLLTAMLERESKREKILEAKLREIKLKVKTANKNDGDECDADGKSPKQAAFKAAIEQAEKDFMQAVESEKKYRSTHLMDDDSQDCDDIEELEHDQQQPVD